jgi:hypothetical protein
MQKPLQQCFDDFSSTGTLWLQIERGREGERDREGDVRDRRQRKERNRRETQKGKE